MLTIIAAMAESVLLCRADEKLTAFGSSLVARSANLLISKEGVRITS